MSETSARVGVGWTIILSSILVATITAFPMLLHILIISSCEKEDINVCNLFIFLGQKGEKSHSWASSWHGSFQWDCNIYYATSQCINKPYKVIQTTGEGISVCTLALQCYSLYETCSSDIIPAAVGPPQ
jgi:hypothetical protein